MPSQSLVGSAGVHRMTVICASRPEAGMGESKSGRTTDDRAVWLYDGLCGFCSWSVRFVLPHERGASSRFVAIQSKLGRQLAIEHAIDPDAPSTFLFLEHGHAHEKSDGVIALAGHLCWPWRALQCLRVILDFPRKSGGLF